MNNQQNKSVNNYFDHVKNNSNQNGNHTSDSIINYNTTLFQTERKSQSSLSMLKKSHTLQQNTNILSSPTSSNNPNFYSFIKSSDEVVNSNSSFRQQVQSQQNSRIQKYQQENAYIDAKKLGKVEKLLTKMEQDILRRYNDLDQQNYMDTLKKSHDIYSLVLREMQGILNQMQLENVGQLLHKIFKGQYNLMNILMKIQMGLEKTPVQMLADLADMKKNRYPVSPGSTADGFFKSTKSFFPGRGPKKLPSLNNIQIQQQKVQASEVYTCMYEDFDKVRCSSAIERRRMEMQEITGEVNEGIKELDHFLNKKYHYEEIGNNNDAEGELKSILRNFHEKKKFADAIELQSQALINQELISNKELQDLSNLVDLIQLIGNRKRNIQTEEDQNIQTDEAETQTTLNVSQMQTQLLRLDADHKKAKNEVYDLKKSTKDAVQQRDNFKQQIDRLTVQVMQGESVKKEFLQLQHTMKRMEQERKSEIIVGKDEKKKIEQLVEDDIRMRLKINEMMEELEQQEKQEKQNFKMFKAFIERSSLDQQQKEAIMNKAAELFGPKDYNKKFNFKELKRISDVSSTFWQRDKFFRSVLGDPIGFFKRIKEDMRRRRNKQKNPDYDADFDENLLGENEQKVIQKVKKKIRRMNSKGEWEEVEIEVEEEVIIDKNTGEVLRRREKPQQGFVQDPNIKAFVDANGGLAVGGMGFKGPTYQSKEEKKANFIPKKQGIAKRNSKGEEYYEVEEEMIDPETGEKIKVKKIQKFTKDKYGNDIVTTEYIDPKTGKKVVQQKRVYKDKDGNEVFEEITTDEHGNKITKKTRYEKDADGNEVEVEEIIDEFGNKKVVRKKKMIDEFGNEVIVQEIINEDGSKQIITQKIGKNGEKIIIEENIDKKGNKTTVEKKLVVGKDGKIHVQETHIGADGKKIVKNIEVIKDADGNEVIKEVTMDESGRMVTKFKKKIKDDKGRDVEVEETVDEFGNKTTKKKYKEFDKDGNEIEVEEIIDKDGNVRIVKKKKNKDGTIEEEVYDSKTGLTTITKKKKDKYGREEVEVTTIDKTGKKNVVTKKMGKDKHGNDIEEITYFDEKTGKMVTIQKKKMVDKHGNEYFEETTLDENGKPLKKTKVRQFKDKHGNVVQEEEIIDSSGKKIKLQKKQYRDSMGREVTEEVRIDEHGNKVIVKKYKDKDGKEIIEETRIGADGTKTTKKQVVREDGTIEETYVDKDGNVVVSIRKQGTEDKDIQCNLGISLEEVLLNMGFGKHEVPLLASQIRNYLETRKPTWLGEKPPSDYYKNQKSNDENLENLDDINMSDEEVDQQLYKKLKQKGNDDVLRQIRNDLGKQGDESISFADFRRFMTKFRLDHQRCGENCPHLARFYARLGFLSAKYRRASLKLKNVKISAFDRKKRQSQQQSMIQKPQSRGQF